MEAGDSTATIGNCSNGISSINKTSTRCTKLSSEFVDFNIDDLPELLLVEILCRLPTNKLVFQCKCVSKRWCKLISSPYFVRHFVNLQRQLQKPILSTLVFEISGMFLPWLDETRSGNRVEEVQEEEEDNNVSPIRNLSVRPPFMSIEESLFVVVAFNDLVLCCATEEYQRDYYLCNPYTKKWVPLPPPPNVHEEAIVGFICDPYCICGSSLSNKKLDIIASTYSSINDIQLCAEYKCRVVRILPNKHVDIFFSEMGEWRESINSVFPSTDVLVNQTGVAHNGKLYWPFYDDDMSYTVELDPFATHPTADGHIFVEKCRFIAAPLEGSVPNEDLWIMRLGACRGSLRACRRVIDDDFSVWELEEEADESPKWRLVVDQVSLCQMESNSQQCLLIGGHKIMLGFHPDDEDIMYFNDNCLILKCNLGSRTLEPVLAEKIDCWINFNDLHPFVLPWWPTPIPTF